MDLLALLRTIGGLGAVLGLLAGALWVVRRYDLRLPGRAVGARERRLELVETLPVDARRTIALVRRDGREHLVLLAPEGHLVLETALVRDAVDQAADEARRAARAAVAMSRDTPAESFAALIERARGGIDPAFRSLAALRDRPDQPPPERMPEPAVPERPKPRQRLARRRRCLTLAATRAELGESPLPGAPSHSATEDPAFA